MKNIMKMTEFQPLNRKLKKNSSGDHLLLGHKNNMKDAKYNLSSCQEYTSMKNKKFKKANLKSKNTNPNLHQESKGRLE